MSVLVDVDGWYESESDSDFMNWEDCNAYKVV